MKMPKLATAMTRTVTQATAWKECRGLDQPFTRDRLGGEGRLPPASGTTRLQLLPHKSIYKTRGGPDRRAWTPPAALWQGGPGGPPLGAGGRWRTLQGPRGTLRLSSPEQRHNCTTLLSVCSPHGRGPRRGIRPDPSVAVAVAASRDGHGLCLQMDADSGGDPSRTGRRPLSGGPHRRGNTEVCRKGRPWLR